MFAREFCMHTRKNIPPTTSNTTVNFYNLLTTPLLVVYIVIIALRFGSVSENVPVKITSYPKYRLLAHAALTLSFTLCQNHHTAGPSFQRAAKLTPTRRLPPTPPDCLHLCRPKRGSRCWEHGEFFLGGTSGCKCEEKKNQISHLIEKEKQEMKFSQQND